MQTVSEIIKILQHRFLMSQYFFILKTSLSGNRKISSLVFLNLSVTEQFYHLIPVIRHVRILRNFIHMFPAALFTAVADLIALTAVPDQSDWLHQPSTGIRAVSRHNIHMQGVQAERAMIPIAPIDRQWHLSAAMDTDK